MSEQDIARIANELARLGAQSEERFRTLFDRLDKIDKRVETISSRFDSLNISFVSHKARMALFLLAGAAGGSVGSFGLRELLQVFGH